jgi:PAS domain S-box-containing protein
MSGRMAQRPLSSRSRFVLAAALATLPLVALVAYAAVDRYNADRARATTRAQTRSQLYATLMAANGWAATPTAERRLLGLAPLTDGGLLVVLDRGQVAASSGPRVELPPGLAGRTGTFHANGRDGVDRVWSLSKVPGTATRIAYGVAGSVVYGASQAALRRDLLLAALAALAAIVAAFALSDRATRPIRRLAAQVGPGTRTGDDIAAIEHGIRTRDAALEEREVELARRAEMLEQLNTELREREHESAALAAIVESSGDAIVAAGLDGTISAWNAAAEELYGYTPEEAIGQHASILAPPDLRYEILALLAQVREGAHVERLETVRMTKDGRRIHVSLTISPIRSHDGEVTGASAITRDITEQWLADERIRQLNEELEERVRDRTEQLERANEELEAFSYSVSHDLRAPLRAIDGFSRLVLEDHAAGLDPDGVRYLELVRKSTDEMARLIDGLLALSRIDQQPLDRREVNVDALVREVVVALVAEHDGRAPLIELDALPPASADPTLLRQVFANLLSNALKFTSGVTRPLIEVGAHAEDGQTVYVVRDNGAGFDMEHADKLFTVFQRLHGRESFEGSGIGLALVARIVARHGGRIWAEGRPDEGAAFYFTLDGADAGLAGREAGE